VTQAWNDNLLRNPHAVADKRTRVQKMFAAIAPSYDLNNRLHSLWMDQSWRKKAVKLANLTRTDRVVDVACGTGDLSVAFARELWSAMLEDDLRRINDGSHPAVRLNPRPGQVTGIDFTFEMLPLARKKTQQSFPYWMTTNPARSERLERKLHRKIGLHTDKTPFTDWLQRLRERAIDWINGDAQSLPLPDQSADVVSIAFGIRNVQEPLVAMKEFFRVLRPGGRAIILEFSLPTNAILRGLYNFYFRKILPRTATLISGDKTGAYKYLPESVNTFIGREQMMDMMRQAGFTQVEQFPLTFGVCVCYRGVKA
jgi:demethylmenaquinone methyltransferase/2-methoxy-6-polyprenyl-1,4-benzoquinol methylase